MKHAVNTILLTLLLSLTSCKKDEKGQSCLPIDAITINNFIKDIIDEINSNYADEITREKLEEGAISGMLGFLDEHSLYINQEEFEAFNQTARGAYLGIGVEIKQIKDGMEISSVIEDTPAFKAGIKNGDVITHIDGKSVADMPIKDVYSKLSSDSALKISLTLVRNKADKFEVNLKKSVIQLQTVKNYFIEDIAIIKINYFNEGTTLSLKSTLRNINKKHPKALILDLRNNPGGILEQAIETAELFLEKGSKIVELKSRNIEESRAVQAEKKDITEGLPIAVLINRNSASGAEVVAIALSENKRAILIGEKTYGKGSMQSIIPIPGKGAIKLTTSFLYSPKGTKFDGEGITPDIVIGSLTQAPQKDDESNPPDIVLQRAIDLLHGLSALSNSED